MQKDLVTFFDKIESSYNSNLPFVVFRKPNEVEITAYIQKTEELYFLNSFKDQGFVFSPFYKNEKKILFPIKKCNLITAKTSEEFVLDENYNNSTFRVIFDENSEGNHIQLVQKGINFINSSATKKVVLSRKEKVECSSFDSINTLKKMLNNYKNAFVYLWFHPAVGLWMGATPERLINVTDIKFKTMALAGTQLFKNTTNVVWKEKEQQEQQFVTDYILDQIRNSIKNIKISEPYSVRAGNLIHIRTDISGELKSDNLLEQLIHSLHPTPAVCGLPKENATKFIVENENYNRAYYSGYLGELNIENNTNIFVNLRCMQVENKIASIYIGGGITAESNPKKEWEETVSKAEVMKKVL
ncbi:MAG: isochorismate synthase [Lutibacter sp.]|uniref:isochorismate synthase n=1 Tax=Lutibacter sp. TaxID=1925666 RepID=UPI001A10668D|nr:isochorismate synthase [Lutibacter sp.]NOR28372.1 isochorismate synthase [Lutibacter sp.]